MRRARERERSWRWPEERFEPMGERLVSGRYQCVVVQLKKIMDVRGGRKGVARACSHDSFGECCWSVRRPLDGRDVVLSVIVTIQREPSLVLKLWSLCTTNSTRPPRSHRKTKCFVVTKPGAVSQTNAS